MADLRETIAEALYRCPGGMSVQSSTDAADAVLAAIGDGWVPRSEHERAVADHERVCLVWADRTRARMADESTFTAKLVLDLRDCRSALASTEGERDTLAGIVDRLTDGCNWRPDPKRAVWVRTIGYEVTYGTAAEADARTGEYFEYPTEPMSPAEVQWFTERGAERG